MQDEIVARYATEATAPAATSPDGSLQEAAAHQIVGHAQRVAEGVNLEIHRTTWRYSKLVDDQRHIVLAQRDRVMRTDAALRSLARRCPDRFAEMSAIASDDVLVDTARQITLWHLDRKWAAHLGYL